MRNRVSETPTPAPHVGLNGWHGLDVSVGGKGRGHLDLTGQQIRVGGVRRRRRVFVRVRRRGRQHHAVELGDVGGEAVYHTADLVHQ